MNNKELSKEEIETLELCTNFAKQQVNDLERKLYACIKITSQDLYNMQKNFVEHIKCVNTFKHRLVEANLLMAACIIVIFIKVFFL
jgi:hypothetical protein